MTAIGLVIFGCEVGRFEIYRGVRNLLSWSFTLSVVVTVVVCVEGALGVVEATLSRGLKHTPRPWAASVASSNELVENEEYGLEGMAQEVVTISSISTESGQNRGSDPPTNGVATENGCVVVTERSSPQTSAADNTNPDGTFSPQLVVPSGDHANASTC